MHFNLKKYIPAFELYRYLVFFVLIIGSLLLLTVVYKNDNKPQNSNINEAPSEHPDFILIKEFFVKKIKSPYINVNYQIKKGYV